MFYKRYVLLCEKKKLSPSAAAAQAGFNKGTVSVWKKKFEAGQDVVPEQDIIDKICAFFGCSEAWLRGIEKAPIQEDERNEDKLGLSEIYFSLAKDLQDAKIDPEDIRNFANIISKNMKKNKDGHE